LLTIAANATPSVANYLTPAGAAVSAALGVVMVDKARESRFLIPVVPVVRLGGPADPRNPR
jgi:hypothetical protein